MSHELRTPLNAVIGFSEALMAGPPAGAAAEYVRSVHEAGRHLLSLIDDILDVTRAETTGFSVAEEAVDLAALAAGAVRVMGATAASGEVALRAELAPGLPAVRGDELRLRQVLLNLLSNAVKFTPPGGSVTVSLARGGAGDLLLRVADTGIGIRAEDIPRAFEAFTQLDGALSRRFQGSGLGLYLSRALAAAQGAELALESAPGAGTTAVLRFPKERLVAPSVAA
jgi:signal transduction histidine kinase